MKRAAARRRLDERNSRAAGFDEAKWDAEIDRAIRDFPERRWVMLNMEDPEDAGAIAFAEDPKNGYTVEEVEEWSSKPNPGGPELPPIPVRLPAVYKKVKF